jgi:hypothetical protein
MNSRNNLPIDHLATPVLTTRLPAVGTTIFTVMSALATEKGAVNLGQGFPDFPAIRRWSKQSPTPCRQRPQPIPAHDRRAPAA